MAKMFDDDRLFSFSGFRNPLMSCCGYGGPPYNYNINVTCGQTGYLVCNEGTQYISWDGVHYSEAANARIASKILSAHYSEPQLEFDYFFRLWTITKSYMMFIDLPRSGLSPFLLLLVLNSNANGACFYIVFRLSLAKKVFFFPYFFFWW